MTKRPRNADELVDMLVDYLWQQHLCFDPTHRATRDALQNLVWAWDQREGVEIAHKAARAVLGTEESVA